MDKKTSNLIVQWEKNVSNCQPWCLLVEGSGQDGIINLQNLTYDFLNLTVVYFIS